MVGHGRDQTPAVLNGPGTVAAAFMVPARSPYSYPIISDSDRVRHQQSDASRGEGFKAALQMDINNANERTARANQARDARNGAHVITGRGD